MPTVTGPGVQRALAVPTGQPAGDVGEVPALPRGCSIRWRQPQTSQGPGSGPAPGGMELRDEDSYPEPQTPRTPAGHQGPWARRAQGAPPHPLRLRHIRAAAGPRTSCPKAPGRVYKHQLSGLRTRAPSTPPAAPYPLRIPPGSRGPWPSFLHVLLLLRPFAGQVAVGSPGSRRRTSVWPPPPGAGRAQGRGAAAAPRAAPRLAQVPAGRHASPRGRLSARQGVPDFGPRAPPLGRPAAGGGEGSGGARGAANGRAACGQRPEACAPPPRLIGGRAWRAGRGDVAGGPAGAARRGADKECAPCARPPVHPPVRPRAARGGEDRPGAHTRTQPARPGPGTWVQIPAPPLDLSVLICIMGTLPRKRMWGAGTLRTCRRGHN